MRVARCALRVGCDRRFARCDRSAATPGWSARPARQNVMRAFVAVAVLAMLGCSERTKTRAEWIAIGVAIKADHVIHGAEYRADFASRHPECDPSTVEANAFGSGSCVTTAGCRYEANCFLE